MPTTRNELLAARELATLVLPACDSAAYHRESCVTVLGLDPTVIGHGRGKRDAYLLQAVLAALRERDGKLHAAAGHKLEADQRIEPNDQARERDERGAEDGE
jgi:hypothetical protein